MAREGQTSDYLFIAELAPCPPQPRWGERVWLSPVQCHNAQPRGLGDQTRPDLAPGAWTRETGGKRRNRRLAVSSCVMGQMVTSPLLCLLDPLCIHYCPQLLAARGTNQRSEGCKAPITEAQMGGESSCECAGAVTMDMDKGRVELSHTRLLGSLDSWANYSLFPLLLCS